MSKKIFVAGPYNHHNAEIKRQRIDLIVGYCVELFQNGDSPISPLMMGMAMVKLANLPTDTETWVVYSETLMTGCDELHVLMLEGWEISVGIQAEVAAAKKLNIPIKYIKF